MAIIGEYICRDNYPSLTPEFIDEWDDWLDANYDPGHWDAYKDRSTHSPTWVCDVYLPPCMFEKFKALTGMDLTARHHRRACVRVIGINGRK